MVSSKGLLMSKLARNIVGRDTHPCFFIGSCFLAIPSISPTSLSSSLASVGNLCHLCLPPEALPYFRHVFSFDQHHNTGSILLAHNTSQCNASDTFLGLGTRFSKEHKLYKCPRVRRLNSTKKRCWKHSAMT